VEEEEEVVASIAGKRAVTLFAHAMVCPMMMALLTGRGKRKRSQHGFDLHDLNYEKNYFYYKPRIDIKL